MRLIKLTEAGSYDVPEKLQKYIDDGRWDAAYTYASSPEYTRENPGQTTARGQESVIHAYLEDFKIKDGAPVVSFIIKSVGMGRDNPFMAYIGNYPKAAGLKKDQWIALNNMYANGDIDPPDLRDQQGNKVGILLYNDGLFKNNLSADEIISLVRAYKGFDKRYGSTLQKLKGKEPQRDYKALIKKADELVQYYQDRDEQDKVKKLQAQIQGWQREVDREARSGGPLNATAREKDDIFFDENAEVRPWTSIKNRLEGLRAQLKK